MATKTWQNGGVDNKWSTVGNWVEGAKPTTGDDVVIGAAVNCVIDENTASLKSLDMTGYANTLSGTGNITIAPAAGPVTVLFAGTITWTGKLAINPANGVTVNFTPAGINTAEVSIGGSGNGTVVFLGSNTIKTLTISGTRTVTFTNGTTTTLSDLFATGASGALITLNSDAAGVPAIISKSYGIISCDYLSIQDLTVTGGASWYAGAHSTNVSGNTGWTFIQAPTYDSKGRIKKKIKKWF